MLSTGIVKFCAIYFWIRDKQCNSKVSYISAWNKSRLYCGLSHVQLLNSRCLKTTQRVKCRTNAINKPSRTLGDRFTEAKIYCINISELVIPHQTLF